MSEEQQQPKTLDEILGGFQAEVKGATSEVLPPELNAEDFTALRNATMAAGEILQMLKPGVLDVAARMIERDLKSEKALRLDSINKRRGEMLMKFFRAAEGMRIAMDDLMRAQSVLAASSMKAGQ